MGRNVRQLVEDVNNLVDENFLPAMIIGWFNEALGDLTEVMRIEAVSRTLTTAGRYEYALPEDHYKTIWVFVDGGKVEPIDIDAMEVGYHEWGGVLTVVPAPSEDNKTIELFYYRTPQYLSPDNLDDEPEVPDRYRHLLVLFAAARTQSRDEDLEEKHDFWRDYLTGKMSYNRETATKVAKHRSLQIKVVR